MLAEFQPNSYPHRFLTHMSKSMNQTKTYFFQLKGVKGAKRNGLSYLLNSAAEQFISKSWMHIGHKLQESECFIKQS